MAYAGTARGDDAGRLPVDSRRDSGRTETPHDGVLQAEIAIPAAAVNHGNDGGDLRIGDLDGDGRVDFIVYKSIGGMKPCYIAAFDFVGKLLWEYGDIHRTVAKDDADGGSYRAIVASRPGQVAVADIDGDGATEVVALVLPEAVSHTSIRNTADMRFVILDGASGTVERSGKPAPLLTADDAHGGTPNWVHQRIMLADFRGIGRPGDFVMKLGNTVFACDERFDVLWTYRDPHHRRPRHASYIPCVGDVDGDGKDEVLGGTYLLDDDGTALWARAWAEHCDSVAIVDWDGNAGNGRECVLSGFGTVVDRRENVLFQLGSAVVPHGQELRVGDYRRDLPGLEAAIRYEGHTTDMLYVDNAGKVLTRFKVLKSPNATGMDRVRWFGDDGPDLLYSPAALYDGAGSKLVALPGLPPPSGGNQGWYHCIPARLDGSGRESIVLYDPYQDKVWVFGEKPLREVPPAGYVHTARQYNVRLMD